MLFQDVFKIVVVCALCVIAGCGGKQQAQNGRASDFPREKTLYVGGDQWGEPNTFNPCATGPPGR